MVSVLKYSSCVLLISLAVCVSAYNRNQGFHNIYPKFPVNPIPRPVQHAVQHPVQRGQIYNQYGPHPTLLPVSSVGFPANYQKPIAYPTYPVPVYGNPFGNIHKDPHAAVVAKSVIYSVLFSALLNRVG